MKILNETTAEKRIRPVRVLQFGEGNFLRAFADWMIDIANERGVTNTSVAIVPPRFKENDGTRTLRKQDGLYHVWLEGTENNRPKTESRLITCVADTLSPTSDFKKYENLILSPELRFVVSNTTEAGIRYECDDIMADTPATFPGKVASLLYRRYRHFDGDTSKGLIFLCCELIEDNGTKLREYVLRHAADALLENGFAEWIDKACVFCDTLVDRIVPGFPHESIYNVKDAIGYDDNMVVKGELFHLWAIGGKGYETVRRELPLDRAGLNVLFMPCIKTFRDKKVRILNGSHTALAAIGLLAGHKTVGEAYAHASVQRFINTMVQREVLTVLDGDSDALTRFAADILERFRNPYMRHMLGSIALNSLSKWETRNFPTVRDVWCHGGYHAEFELFGFAALLALYAPRSGFTPDDDTLAIAKINTIWNENHGDTDAIVRRITSGGIFAEDFEAAVPGFSEKAGQYLADIRSAGTMPALESFLRRHNV